MSDHNTDNNGNGAPERQPDFSLDPELSHIHPVGGIIVLKQTWHSVPGLSGVVSDLGLHQATEGVREAVAAAVCQDPDVKTYALRRLRGEKTRVRLGRLRSELSALRLRRQADATDPALDDAGELGRRLTETDGKIRELEEEIRAVSTGLSAFDQQTSEAKLLAEKNVAIAAHRAWAAHRERRLPELRAMLPRIVAELNRVSERLLLLLVTNDKAADILRESCPPSVVEGIVNELAAAREPAPAAPGPSPTPRRGLEAGPGPETAPDAPAAECATPEG
jgi:hypothetical protein